MNFSANITSCPWNVSLRAQAIQPLFRNFTTSWKQSPFVNARRVMSVLIIFFVTLGCIGNVLCLLTTIRWEIKRFSTKFFFCIIAVCDLFSFPVNMAYVWTLFTYNIIPENHSQIVCKAFRFTINHLSMTSWWALMFVSIERFLLVVAPNRMRVVSQKIIFLSVIAFLALEVLLISILSVFLDFRLDGCVCVFYGSQWRYLVFMLLGILTNLIMPIQAIVSSAILIYVLWRKSQRVGDVNHRQNSDSLSLTPFKICAGLTVSQFVFMISFGIISFMHRLGSLSHVDGGLLGFVYWTTYLLFFMAFGSNFFFSFAISRQFRRTALEMLHVIRSTCRPTPNAIAPAHPLSQLKKNVEPKSKGTCPPN